MIGALCQKYDVSSQSCLSFPAWEKPGRRGGRWRGPRAANLGLRWRPRPSSVGRGEGGTQSTSKFHLPTHKGKSHLLKQRRPAGHPRGWSPAGQGPARPHLAPGHAGQESIPEGIKHTGGRQAALRPLGAFQVRCTYPGTYSLRPKWNESRSRPRGPGFTVCVYHRGLVVMP